MGRGVPDDVGRETGTDGAGVAEAEDNGDEPAIVIDWEGSV